MIPDLHAHMLSESETADKLARLGSYQIAAAYFRRAALECDALAAEERHGLEHVSAPIARVMARLSKAGG